MSEPAAGARPLPGAEFAGSVIRISRDPRARPFPDGLFVDLYGFPDFLNYARIVVETEDPPPGLGIDEARVTDVLAANLAAAATGDPIYADTPELATPRGWTWHHVPRTRLLYLVPVDVKNSLRHAGGVTTLAVNRDKTGLWTQEPGEPAGFGQGDVLVEEDLAHLETKYIGHRLPEAYRMFMAANGGGRPARPAVDPDHGFVLDQAFLNLFADPDPYDLLDVAHRMREWLTRDFQPIAFVQGGALVLRTRGEDTGSVWYWDNDDARDDGRYGPEEVCSRLLMRLADDLVQFLTERLVEVPGEIESISRSAVAGGHYRVIRLDGQGEGLPAALRPDTEGS